LFGTIPCAKALRVPEEAASFFLLGGAGSGGRGGDRTLSAAERGTENERERERWTGEWWRLTGASEPRRGEHTLHDSLEHDSTEEAVEEDEDRAGEGGDGGARVLLDERPRRRFEPRLLAVVLLSGGGLLGAPCLPGRDAGVEGRPLDRERSLLSLERTRADLERSLSDLERSLGDRSLGVLERPLGVRERPLGDLERSRAALPRL
jgi:hypothetical protein